MVSGRKKDITKQSKAKGTKPDRKCTPILSVSSPMYGISELKLVPTTTQNPVAKPRTVDGNSSLV